MTDLRDALSRDCHDDPPGACPSDERAPAGTICRHCGRAHPGGRFLAECPGPGLTHGRRSRSIARGALLPPGAPLPADRAAAVLADLGDVSTLQASLVTRYVHVELVAEWLEGNLLAQGVLTGKGKRRAAVSAYLSVVDRLARLAGQLGLERRPRQLGTLDAVHAAVARANEGQP
jgi:hypothetical protein